MSGEHDKDRAKAIEQVESHGWRVARITRSGYTIMRCSCGRHQHRFPKTPSGRNTFRHIARFMIRECSTVR